MKLIKQTSFWRKLEATFGLIGATSVTTMGIEQVHYGWFIAVGAFGLVAKLIFIWIEDKDSNGVVDLFEDK